MDLPAAMGENKPNVEDPEVIMDAFGGPRKRARGDTPVNGNGNGHAAPGSMETECRKFNSPEGCPYGDACRFRHVVPSSPVAATPVGPPAATTPLPSEKEPPGGMQSATSRTKPCTKFFSTSGCPYGEGCHFLHYVPGGVNALGLSSSSLSNIGGSGSFSSNNNVRKVIGGVGPAGLPTPVSPGDQGANLGGFKTRLCNRFDTPEGCRFGEKCHFAHGEKELRKSGSHGGFSDRDSMMDLSRGRSSVTGGGQLRGQNGGNVFSVEGRYSGGGRDGGRAYGLREPTPPGLAAAASFGASSTAKISIEASLAGAIIGKGGVNAKQICRVTGAKLSIREHESDASLRNVEMEGSFEQIQQASKMVRQVLMQRDNVPVKQGGFSSHNFKTKMCENYAQGTCTFGDRCHFAHGAHEMRDHALRA